MLALSYPGTRGQEITVRGSETSHCFTDLSPETDYSVTVFVQTPNLEGPGVSVKERTSKCLSKLGILRKASE